MKYFYLPVLLIIFSVVGCKTTEENKEIVTTIYPFKAILEEVAGNRFEVKSILPAGADPHTYEMLPSDFRAIQNAKVFFYGSSALDGWAANLDVKNKVELLDLVPKNFLRDIEIHHESDNREEHIGTDPHFWTDPLTVKAALPQIVNEFIRIDPEGEKFYKNNSADFSSKLDQLDSLIKIETTDIKYRNVFTDHPFYSYFFDRYGFNVVGSIEIAPGSQPTPKDIENLIKLVKAKNVKAIFTHQQQSDKPANVLAESAGIKVFTLDPTGGVKGRMTYSEIILHNLSIIKDALK
jgi:zinc transport system substrate-binding protein